MTLKIIKLKKFIGKNGALTPIYLKRFPNFKIKRLFILSGNKDFIRGKHAHKKCTQIFIPISGSVKVEVLSKSKKKYTLGENLRKILIIPPMNWCELKFLKNKSSLLVLCDVEYSEKEYIRDFNIFSKKVNIKKIIK